MSRPYRSNIHICFVIVIKAGMQAGRRLVGWVSYTLTFICHLGQWARRVNIDETLHLVACGESIEPGQIPYGNLRRGRGRKKIY